MSETYRKMDMRRMVHAVFSRWWICLVTIMVFTLATAYVTLYVSQPVYQGEAYLFLMTRADQNAAIEPKDLEVSDQMVMDYRAMINSPVIAQKAIKALGLNITVDAFLKNLNVNSTKESRMVSITYESQNQTLAADAANKVAELSITQMEAITGVVTGQIIQSAEVPTVPTGPKPIINILAGGIAGLLFGILLALLLEMLDDRIRNERDVEKVLGLKVVGRIASL